MLDGLFSLPWWGYVVTVLALTHGTIVSVTIFLHRAQAHRALTLHPALSHLFRFWLWLTTGMVTREWVAVHRKHHAHCDADGDPHSPQLEGISTVLWRGAELYRQAAKSDPGMLARYGQGTPDDWLERHLYGRHPSLGLGLMLLIDLLCFGVIGLSIWAIQMAWIPFFAAGVINGIGHFWGYRNFQPEDASRNIVPWGILIGGEELHNNHHAYATSARLSNRWYEFDIGWLYIRILEILGLAQVKKVAPTLRFDTAKTCCDVATLQAVITHRYEVLAKYAKSLRSTCADELVSLRARAITIDRATLKRWLHMDTAALPDQERRQRDEVLLHSRVLATIYSMRDELAELWQRSNTSKEQLVHQLEDWCRRAEESGIEALQAFSRRLRCYA